MNNDLPPDIAAIEARHAECGRRGITMHRRGEQAHADRATLLRAYRELAQENERLRARLELTVYRSDGTPEQIDIGDCDGIACRDATIEILDGNVSRLRALRERLLAALEQIASAANHQAPPGLTADHLHGYWMGRAESLCLVATKAIAAAQQPDPEYQPRALSQPERDALNRALDKSVTVVDEGYEHQPIDAASANAPESPNAEGSSKIGLSDAPCDAQPAIQNCGYDHTCSGWVVRSDGFHVATFRRKADADQYVRLIDAEGKP